MSSAVDRVRERLDGVHNPAIARLVSVLSSGKDAEEAYVKWRRNPVTRMFIEALEELADSPPPFSQAKTDTNYVLLQSGMTDGLNLAVRLLRQPYRVYPGVLSGDAEKTDGKVLEPLNRAFEDTLDDVIDDM